MPVIINGNGTVDTGTVLVGNSDITGLAAGALPSTVIGAGAVLQVVQTVKTDTFTTTSTSLVDVTGLSVSITPTSATSKILVIAMVNVSNDDANFAYISLLRGSSQIFIGDASAGRVSVTAMTYVGGFNEGSIQAIPITFLDSPSSTSSQTYKIQIRVSTTGTALINRSFRDEASTNYDMRVPSSITVMEIAA